MPAVRALRHPAVVAIEGIETKGDLRRFVEQVIEDSQQPQLASGRDASMAAQIASLLANAVQSIGGVFTRMNWGNLNVASGASAVANHGLGVTAEAVACTVVGYGLGTGGAFINYDIPNSTQIRIYNPGSPVTLTITWFAFA